MRRLRPALVLGAWALTLASATAACGGPDPVAVTPPTGGAKGRVARYEMAFREDLTIDVTAVFEAGVGTRFVIDDAMDAEIQSIEPKGAGPSTWTWTTNEIEAPGCKEGCTLRYHYDMPRAAERFDTGDMVEKRAGAFVGTPSIWIARPVGVSPQASYTVDVEIAAPNVFAWGLAREGETYVGVYDDADESPYATVGRVRRFSIGTETQGFDVMVAGPDPDIGIDALLDWPRAALANVQSMFPTYPRVRPMLVVMVRHGDGIEDGTALGNGGASIRIEVGDETPKERLAADWMLTHEMTHLALPGLRRKHHWAEEGMATYLEPIMRAKRGVLPVGEVWREWFQQMHKGQARDAEDRLDGTREWGRTYWGGALFWFQCDVAIRSRAKDPLELGLPVGFQSVFLEGDISNKWSIERFLGGMDAATKTDVVSSMYAEQAPVGVPIDLDAMWRQLGVSLKDGKASFDETAPLAAVREAMVVGP